MGIHSAKLLELYHKLQSCASLNNFFGKTLNAETSTGIGSLHPFWQLLNISEKEQAIIKYTFQFLLEKR